MSTRRPASHCSHRSMGRHCWSGTREGAIRSRRRRKRFRMGHEIYFVRHGESTANTARVISNKVADYAPLTAKGRQQAEELLNRLRERGSITAIHASPLMRAKETAEMIALGLGLEVQIAEALREPYCGVLEGRGDDEAWSHHARQERAWRDGHLDYSVPGGESLRDVETRLVPFLERPTLKFEQPPGNVLIVSHGSILKNMLPRVLSNVGPEFARANPIGNCDVVVAAYQGNMLTCVEWCGLTPKTV